MKKIMFNDKYGLTTAVLEGRKTQTRRIVGNRMTEYDIDAYMRGYHDVAYGLSPFKIGEVVAIAQSYHDAGYPPTECFMGLYRRRCDEAGWNNKMFVKAEEMQHFIKITDIKIETLQEISDEDCLKEGVIHYADVFGKGYMLAEPYNNNYRRRCFTTPQKAFSALIDKVSGKGTWDKNPWVFVYDFELVK